MRRHWVLDHLLDITVGVVVVMMLAFLVADIARGDADGIGSALLAIATLVSMWAIVRIGLGRKR